MTTNWGRWGENDQRGAANLIDEAAVARALAAVRDHRVISLAADLDRRGPAATNRAPLQHFFTRTGADYATGARRETDQMGFADDYITVATHGATHIDALCHVWSEATMYNGFGQHLVSSSGSQALGIERLGPIVTRAVLLDAAAHDVNPRVPVGPTDLDRLLQDAGVEPSPGDALLVRTGWRAEFTAGRPRDDAAMGLSRDCASWVIDRDLVLVGADNPAVEVVGPAVTAPTLPLHVSLLRNHGIYLLELLDLEELAATGRSDIMLVLNPLPVLGASGGLCAPVAII